MASSPSDDDVSPSDSELPSGLPSPDASDDDELQSCVDCGVQVAYFCNKLRQQMRPLLSINGGIPSPTKQLRDSDADRCRDSKAKKRLFKADNQELQSGILERRYGYIPNPRWPKMVSPFKPFEPQGTEKETNRVPPGVKEGIADQRKRPVGRRGKKNNCHQYKETDFPLLNLSSARTSPVPEGSGCLSLSMGSSSSLLTSTPAHGQDEGAAVSATPSPIGLSHNSSTGGNVLSQSACSEPRQSKESSLTKPSSHGNGRRKSDSMMLKAGNPASDCSSQEDSVSTARNKSLNSSLTEAFLRSSAWSDVARRSPVPPSWSDVARRSPVPPASGADVAQKSPVPTAWSDVVRKSPVPTVWSDIVRKSPIPAGSDMPRKSPVPNARSDVARKSPVPSSWSDVARKSPVPSSWSDVARKSPVPMSGSDAAQKSLVQTPAESFANREESTQSKLVSPSAGRPSSSVELSKNSSVEGKTSRPVHTSLSEGCIKNLASSKDLDAKQDAKANSQVSMDSHNIHQKPQCFSSGNSSSQDQGPRCQQPRKNGGKGNKPKTPSNLVDAGGNQNKGSRKGKKGNSGPRALTLESFMTTRKLSDKENWSKNESKEISLLEQRLLTDIHASATSPPKKVRPSPIKRLSFSRTEEENPTPSDAGDASTILKEPAKRNSKKKLCLTSDVSGKRNLQAQGVILGKPVSVVTSLEKCFDEADAEVSHLKDMFLEDENEDKLDCYTQEEKNQILEFWKSNANNSSQNGGLFKAVEGAIPATVQKVTTCQNLRVDAVKSQVVGGEEIAHPSKVTARFRLLKYAQRYCHFVEDHKVPNISVELYFLIQLLTCSEVNVDMLHRIEMRHGPVAFLSVHNGVYFAVKAIKRLRRLFLCLDTSYLELLSRNERLKIFSPKLHDFFVKATASRKSLHYEPLQPAHEEHRAFSATDDGMASFPDKNCAHVFKCQRDNFYAFYRHYHDRSMAYEFHMESQIHYVYDGNTPEQNSVVNLVHLAKLYLDHMVLCCVQKMGDSVDLVKMLQAKEEDQKMYMRLYEAFYEKHSGTWNSACPAPGFTADQMFFKDFLDTLSCPAFNEHLRTLVVAQILELNSKTFTLAGNLHSAVTIGDDETPLRNEQFTETVLTLCMLGRLLGYLVFSPYTSGNQTLPEEHSATLASMREMVPLPLPMPLLLKQAYDNGHLCLTVPWMVEYLTNMDLLAPRLPIYNLLLRKLHFIQRYAWSHLYKSGHHNSGLLVTSCISWLFEAPAVPDGFFFSCGTDDSLLGPLPKPLSFQIDTQKLVSEKLLSSCCPYLAEGKVLLTMFELGQKVLVAPRELMLLTELADGEKPDSGSTSPDTQEIQQWLGSSLTRQDSTKGPDHQQQEAKKVGVIDEEVVPSYFLQRLVREKPVDDLEDLEQCVLQNRPYLQGAVDTAVNLLCSKVIDFTHGVTIRMLLFRAKADVRQRFQETLNQEDFEDLRDELISKSNLMAEELSEEAHMNFFTLVEYTSRHELKSLLTFLASKTDEDVVSSVIPIAQRKLEGRLKEWADVQIGKVVFKRAVVREAERCAMTSPQNLMRFPNDYSRKLAATCPELEGGFSEIDQMSELIDKTLSMAVWYMNGQTPGPRPSEKNMLELIKDLTSCVRRRAIIIDFSFYVLSNLMLQLIIHYMVDAPFNWTDQCLDALIQLCQLCRERKLESDRSSVRMPEHIRKKRRMTVKVTNFMSVHSLQCLSRGENMDHTLMVYCQTLVKLVRSRLLSVDTVFAQLSGARNNPNLDQNMKAVVNRALVKVLSILYKETAADDEKFESGKSPNQLQIVKVVHDLALTLEQKGLAGGWSISEKVLAQELKDAFEDSMSDGL